MASPKFHNTFRQYHRWLGFFLAGIMAIYAISGVLLIFRNTDFLKYEQVNERQLDTGLKGSELGPKLRLKGFAIEQESAEKVVFKGGTYNKQTGKTVLTGKDYPFVLAKLVKLHKATTNSPLFFLNIGFGLTLLFFVISSLLMFIPRAAVYKNGLKIAGVGAIFAVLVVIFGS